MFQAGLVREIHAALLNQKTLRGNSACIQQRESEVEYDNNHFANSALKKETVVDSTCEQFKELEPRDMNTKWLEWLESFWSIDDDSPDGVITQSIPVIPNVFGSDASERLIGTNEDDIIFGGWGADKFRTKKGDDTILDFEVGIDSLKGKFKELEISYVNGGTLMEYKRGSVFLSDLELTSDEIFG